MKKLIIALFSLVFVAKSALALDFNTSIGVSGNMGVYAATGTEKNYDETGASVVDTTKEYGAFSDSWGSIFAEVGNDLISLGVDYVPMTIETPQNVGDDASNSNKVKAEFDNLITIYTKINIPQLGGAYIKAGYSIVDITSVETMVSGSKYPDADTSGLVAGLGYAKDIGSNGMSLRAEITYAQFDDVEVSNNSTNKNTIKVEDMIGARGTISLVKSF
jgi:hypothetical protein